MSKRWALRLLLAVMLLAAFSAAVSADEGDGWYDASQEEYFWQDQQEVVFPDVTPEHWSYDDVMYLYRNGIIGGFPDGTFPPGGKSHNRSGAQNDHSCCRVCRTGDGLEPLGAGLPQLRAGSGHFGARRNHRSGCQHEPASDREGLGACARRDAAGRAAEVYRYE